MIIPFTLTHLVIIKQVINSHRVSVTLTVHQKHYWFYPSYLIFYMADTSAGSLCLLVIFLQKFKKCSKYLKINDYYQLHTVKSIYSSSGFIMSSIERTKFKNGGLSSGLLFQQNIINLYLKIIIIIIMMKLILSFLHFI